MWPAQQLLGAAWSLVHGFKLPGALPS
jgi:hypothetical protein